MTPSQEGRVTSEVRPGRLSGECRLILCSGAGNQHEIFSLDRGKIFIVIPT